MEKKYRVQYEIRLFEDVGMHILRWLLLTTVTAGVAALFYPFYFVRFMAERITIVVED